MQAREMKWRNNPARGTLITVGFDGSENNDWTAIRCETKDGLSFTPRYGPDRRPTIWSPDQWGGEIPRNEVNVAVSEIFERWQVKRMYCDPQYWTTEIGEWAVEYGEEIVFEWATNRVVQMHAALERFRMDLKNRRITHDGCPITAKHMDNAHKVAARGDRYVLGKPAGAYHRKIDASMATVLAHEAAADTSTSKDGWSDDADTRMFCFG